MPMNKSAEDALEAHDNAIKEEQAEEFMFLLDCLLAYLRNPCVNHRTAKQVRIFMEEVITDNIKKLKADKEQS